MDDPVTLVRRWCREGDEPAFCAFYRGQSERLWRYLVARGVDPETAYDVLSDAFERWMKNVCRDPSSPVALLYRIAMNRATDLHRRQRVREPGPAADPDTLSASDLPPELEHEATRLVASLPVDEQNLLLLRYWAGLTHREVASVLDRPEGTVRRETAAILHVLKARLDDD